MASDRPTQPPPAVMIPELNTPDHTNTFFRELVSREDDRFKQLSPIKRGTLYQDCLGADARTVEQYPPLYFCKETVPSGSNTVAGMSQADWVIWEWSSGVDSDSTFNAEISYLADATSNPVFARVYTVRRDEYEATPAIAPGSPLTALVGVKITDGGSSYKHAEAEFDCYGDDAAVEFVISDGVIISAIVTAEGVNFNDGSIINIVGDGSGATCEAIVQPLGAILTSQKKIEFPESDPMSHEFVKVLRVYEVLPGPWVPFTRYDNDLGPVQGRRRAVLNTGQRGGVISGTSKQNFEGRDGSSLVLIEIQENWTDGSGSDANHPLFPRIVWATYSDERGDVQHFSQVQLADPLQVPPDATLVRLLGKLVKTFFEPFPDNPYLLKKIIETWVEVVINDQELTSEFGGAIADVTERTNEPGVQNPERGLMVISSKTTTKSPDEQTLRTVKSPLSSWPSLLGHRTDETTGIVVNFTKQVIDAGTPYPGTTAQSDDCTLVLIQGPFIEDQPYDFDKTIRVISAVDLNTLPKKQCWPIRVPVDFPPQLLSVEAIWGDFDGRTTSAEQQSGVNTTFVQVSSGSNGGIAITNRSGFRGYATGRQERSYFYGPPNAGLVPTIFRILTVSGAVVMIVKNTSTNTSQDENGGISFHDESHTQATVHEIGGHLVGPPSGSVQLATSPNYRIFSNTPGDTLSGTLLTHKSPAVGPITASPPTISIIAAGTDSTMQVQIPQSVPPVLPYGDEIVYDVKITEHPFGIWEMNVIYVTIPYPNAYPP